MVNYRGFPGRNYFSATPIKANDRIVRTNSSGVIDASLIPIDLGANKYTRSTSPPENPVTGDLWDELGNDWLLWRYSGTRWMSVQIFQQLISASGVSSSSDIYINLDYLSLRYDVYVLFFAGIMNVATTNNTTNYWSGIFRRTTSANVETTISTATTLSNNPDSYIKFKNQLNLLIDTAAVAGFTVRHSRTGAPGALISNYGMVFRWVRT